ncbi:MAG: hypothetical protein QMC67_14590 [Candidatus Wallbacteria bacterium]
MWLTDMDELMQGAPRRAKAPCKNPGWISEHCPERLGITEIN